MRDLKGKIAREGKKWMLYSKTGWAVLLWWFTLVMIILMGLSAVIEIGNAWNALGEIGIAIVSAMVEHGPVGIGKMGSNVEVWEVIKKGISEIVNATNYLATGGIFSTGGVKFLVSGYVEGLIRGGEE
jgi:hypothetical protein